MRHLTVYISSLFLLSTIVIFYGCKKDNPKQTISASGTVLNDPTGKPISNITITLKQASGSSSIGGSGSWFVIDTKTTDNNGNFSFSKEVQGGDGWMITINDYNSKYLTTWYQIQPNTSSVQTTYLYQNATLTVTAQTTNPLASGDKFYLNLPGIGCSCFSLTSIRAKAGAYNKITWSVIRNSVTQNFEDTVYCPIDTVKYSIINY